MSRMWFLGLILCACRPTDDVKTDETPLPPDTTPMDSTPTEPTGASGTTGTTGDTGTAVGEASIAGSWRSEGKNISPLFQGVFFQFVRIDADFAMDDTYLVESEDVNGVTVTFTGTYAVDTTSDPATIVLSQLTPAKATAAGIWQVDADVLTYEVVQTVPDIGASAPTPASGFGSTTSPGLVEGDNVQIYVPR